MDFSLFTNLLLPALLIVLVIVAFRRKQKSKKPDVPDLQIIDKAVGNGEEAKKDDCVSVHYTGRLHANGKKFDSSVDRGRPFDFTLGQRRVIAGWEKGVVGMRVGGKRKLIIPPALGYGDRGAPPTIPPGATLEFDIELLAIK